MYNVNNVVSILNCGYTFKNNLLFKLKKDNIKNSFLYRIEKKMKFQIFENISNKKSKKSNPIKGKNVKRIFSYKNKN